jgi:hypothetical protein
MTNRDIPVTDALERWSDIQDDTAAIIACGERWKVIAQTIGCQLHGFNDERSASFITPDGNVIEIGPKFRQALTIQGDTGDGLVEREIAALIKKQGNSGPYPYANAARVAIDRTIAALSTRPPVDVEGVARAIANKRNEFLGLPPAYWSDGEWNGTDLVLSPTERDLYRAEAKAAIASLAPRSSGGLPKEIVECLSCEQSNCDCDARYDASKE